MLPLIAAPTLVVNRRDDPVLRREVAPLLATAISGLEFEDAGAHQLKGVPGEWRVLRVMG